jgi:hypothetical protein
MWPLPLSDRIKAMAKTKRRKIRYPLLVYQSLGRRLRTLPLLTAISGLLLFALGWVGHSGTSTISGAPMTGILWDKRGLIVVMIAGGLALYLLAIVIARLSYVEVKAKALRVRTGLLALDVSYRRIKQIRLVQFGVQYPPDEMRARDLRLVRPFVGISCTALDMRSWPLDRRLLKYLWIKFMFAREGDSILLVVEDAMRLNQLIDERVTILQSQEMIERRGYKDPIARAAEKKSSSGRSGL